MILYIRQFNMNISHQFSDYKLTYVNSQIQKVILYTKPVWNICFKDFLYLTQIWYDKFN